MKGLAFHTVPKPQLDDRFSVYRYAVSQMYNRECKFPVQVPPKRNYLKDPFRAVDEEQKEEKAEDQTTVRNTANQSQPFHLSAGHLASMVDDVEPLAVMEKEPEVEQVQSPPRPLSPELAEAPTEQTILVVGGRSADNRPKPDDVGEPRMTSGRYGFVKSWKASIDQSIYRSIHPSISIINTPV